MGMRHNFPTFEHEDHLWKNGFQYIAGVDEVGRGAFAGPVVAAAVILPPSFPQMEEVNDSKLLSAKKRTELAAVIQTHALAYSIAEISVEVINTIGIGKATQQAFLQAVTSLSTAPDHILIDAFYIDGIAKEQQTPIIHGDQISISIAAASIIAKAYRDNLMSTLDTKYRVYDFPKHKGYGTKAHRDAIKAYGLCDLHRMSFELSKYIKK